ncbi:MAG: DUF2156 domain-containing protein [Acidobacteria bacterium]|nr:MAG: DUF2156 domain-containing protein [Acidobacteriota bacterium]
MIAADPTAIPEALARSRELVLAHGYNATAYQILNPGIRRWFSPAGDAVVGYVPSGGYRVVAGSPVCAPDRLAAAVAAFEDDTHRRGRWSCYFAAEERLARLLARRGPLDRILLGAQPVWDPSAWPAILARKASLRAQLYRARNKGVVVTRWPAERATAHPSLKRCLDHWLAGRGLPPLHFLIEPETLGRLYDRRVFVAARGDDVVGFLVASPVPARRGWLVEQTIRGPGAPNGTSELLLDAAMRHLAAGGAAFVTLGLSPLSRRAGVTPPPQPWWIRLLLDWLRAHGRRFYNFEGLDSYKAKFLPQAWEPIYAITSERRVGLGTLYAIAGAFGKTPPPLLLLRAVARAARQEARWLGQRFERGRPA